jgi:hypothetical protein
MTGRLPAVSMHYALPETADAWGKFLRRYEDYTGAIGIGDEADYHAIVIPHAAALAMFLKPDVKGWPLQEFRNWGDQFGLNNDWLSVGGGYKLIRQGLDPNNGWFLYVNGADAYIFRGLLLAPQTFLRVQKEQGKQES